MISYHNNTSLLYNTPRIHIALPRLDAVPRFIRHLRPSPSRSLLSTRVPSLPPSTISFTYPILAWSNIFPTDSPLSPCGSCSTRHPFSPPLPPAKQIRFWCLDSYDISSKYTSLRSRPPAKEIREPRSRGLRNTCEDDSCRQMTHDPSRHSQNNPGLRCIGSKSRVIRSTHVMRYIAPYDMHCTVYVPRKLYVVRDIPINH